MKIFIHVSRILLGLVFVVFGSNAFLHFIPMPPMQGLPAQFMGALAQSGYLQVIGGLQVAGGLCLLVASRLVPLGLTLLGPIIVNIVCYHLFIDHMFNPIALLVCVLALFLLWIYRFKFPAIFQP
jgi:putative oxidoreductase